MNFYFKNFNTNVYLQLSDNKMELLSIIDIDLDILIDIGKKNVHNIGNPPISMIFILIYDI